MGSHPYNLTGREHYGDVFSGHKNWSKFYKGRCNRLLSDAHIQEELSQMEDDSDILPLWHDDMINNQPKPSKFYKKDKIEANKKSYHFRRIDQNDRHRKAYSNPFPWSKNKC